jgi:hypothetical protein
LKIHDCRKTWFTFEYESDLEDGTKQTVPATDGTYHVGLAAMIVSTSPSVLINLTPITVELTCPQPRPFNGSSVTAARHRASRSVADLGRQLGLHAKRPKTIANPKHCHGSADHDRQVLGDPRI